MLIGISFRRNITSINASNADIQTEIPQLAEKVCM